MSTGTYCSIAPFAPIDSIVTPRYKVRRWVTGSLADDVTLTSSGITAIPNVTNGYVAQLLLTLNADGSYEGQVEWDSGGGSNPGEPYLNRISIPRNQ